MTTDHTNENAAGDKPRGCCDDDCRKSTTSVDDVQVSMRHIRRVAVQQITDAIFAALEVGAISDAAAHNLIDRLLAATEEVRHA